MKTLGDSANCRSVNKPYTSMIGTRPVVPITPTRNDDAAELARRRQSGSARSRQSILDVARQVAETPVRGGRGARGARGVSASEQEEWLNMVRSNRVVTTNAFTIPIIDTFYSILQGEELDENPGIFRQASQTLGGCVTVYKTRVGRISEDTTQLIVSLREGHKKKDKRGQQSGEGEEGDAEEDDSIDQARRRKKARRSDANANLVSEDKLRIDTHELQTTFDPVLLKMSRDFDKRGPTSLLQYSIFPNDDGLVVLDTDDDEQRPAREPPRAGPSAPSAGSQLQAIAEEDEEEARNESNDTPGPDGGPDTSNTMEVDSDMLSDPSGLTSTTQTMIASSTGVVKPRAPSANHLHVDLAQMAITYFGKIKTADAEVLPLAPQIVSTIKNPHEGTENLLREMRAWSAADPGDRSLYVLPESEENEQGVDDGEAEPLELKDYGSEWAQTDQERGFEDELGDYDAPATYAEDVPPLLASEPDHSTESALSVISAQIPPDGNWLDVSFLKQLEQQPRNWTGPAHWKIRRLVREQPRASSVVSDDANLSVDGQRRTRARRMARAPTLINFLDETPVDLAALFKATRKATTLPEIAVPDEQEHLLPTDLHVKAESLVTLALMPKKGIPKSLRRRADPGLQGLLNSDDMQDMYDVEDDAPSDIGLDPGYGDDLSEQHGDVVPSAQAIPSSPPARAGEGQLAYSRTAKRVDIRLLKTNLWHAIEETQQENHTESVSMLSAIKETEPRYTGQQLANLSPSLYFISLLHLANEQGLRLQNTPDLNDIVISTSRS